VRQSNYLKRASKRFLAGTRCKWPCDAVESGIRTLEQWASILAEERDIELHHQELQKQAKHLKVMRRLQRSSGHDHATV
jgi:hypothetical protein